MHGLELANASGARFYGTAQCWQETVHFLFSFWGCFGWCSQSGHRGRERTETRGVPASLLCCSRGFCRLSLGWGRALVPPVPEHRELSTAGFPWPLELGWCRASLPSSPQGLLRSWAARPPALQVLYFGAVLASVVPAFVWLRAVCIGVSSRGDASLLSRPGAPHQAACRSPDKLRALGLLQFPSCWCRNGNLFFSNDLILLRASGDISTTVNSISVTEGSAKCWIVFICGGWRFSFLRTRCYR